MEAGAQQESTAWRQRSGREGKKNNDKMKNNEEGYMSGKKKKKQRL